MLVAQLQAIRPRRIELRRTACRLVLLDHLLAAARVAGDRRRCHRQVPRDDARIDQSFQKTDINDLLKSIILEDFGKGRIAAVSYDSREVLADFARRKKISYALLSDPDSTIIRAFGILNTSIPEGDSGYGIPHPGVYRVNESGLVQAKFFEEA